MPGPFSIAKRYIDKFGCNCKKYPIDSRNEGKDDNKIIKMNNDLASYKDVVENINDQQVDMGHLTAEIRNIIRTEFGMALSNKRAKKQKTKSK